MQSYKSAKDAEAEDDIKQRAASLEWSERLRSVVDSPDGLYVFAEIFNRCGWNNSTFKTNSGSFFAEGRKSVAEELSKELLEIDPALFLKVVTHKSKIQSNQ